MHTDLYYHRYLPWKVTRNSNIHTTNSRAEIEVVSFACNWKSHRILIKPPFNFPTYYTQLHCKLFHLFLNISVFHIIYICLLLYCLLLMMYSSLCNAYERDTQEKLFAHWIRYSLGFSIKQSCFIFFFFFFFFFDFDFL